MIPRLLALFTIGLMGLTAPTTSADGLLTDISCTDGGGSLTTQTPPVLSVLQPTLAWEASQRGSGVVVAVVDSGVDAANVHLTPAVLPGIDLVGDGVAPNGFQDLDGHGTIVSGVIAAREVPGSGVIGLAPEARILPVRVYAGQTDQVVAAGNGPRADRLAAGIRAAADAGAQIINVSMKVNEDTPELRDAVAYAIGHGALVVASAGNVTTDTSGATSGPVYPAASPGVLAVAAVNLDGSPSPDSFTGSHVDIAAPGQSVLSTQTGGKDCRYSDDSAQTSFATAYVSAAAALVAAAHPDETPEQWAYRLMETAVGPDPDRRDDQIGWGIVQPFDAIALVPGSDLRGPENPFTQSSPTPVTGEAAPLLLSEPGSVWHRAREAAAIGAVLGLVVVGTALPIRVLRRRAQKPAMLTRVGGLFRQDPDPSRQPPPTLAGDRGQRPVRVNQRQELAS